MRARGLLLAICSVLVLACLSVGFSSATAAAEHESAGRDFVDRDCSDFSSQSSAQSFFLNNGGPNSDPHSLDADNDGIACESNPCPCSPNTNPSPTPTATATPTTASPTATPTATSSVTGSPTGPASPSPTSTATTDGPHDIPGGEGDILRLRELVAKLPVGTRSAIIDYDRDALFGDWIEQGGGCDTRAVVLKEESYKQTQQTASCTVTKGYWLSAYNGRFYKSAYGGRVQVDHVVPVANAWVAGASKWTHETRVRFYNDLTDHRALVAVDAGSNAAKSDSTPDEWLPKFGLCRYVEYYAVTKYRWALTVTTREKGALVDLAQQCKNEQIVLVTARIDYED